MQRRKKENIPGHLVLIRYVIISGQRMRSHVQIAIPL